MWPRTRDSIGHLLPPLPAGTNPFTTDSTIYIGGMYEEDITPGSSTTQYTSYYTLGGKFVGMHRVVGNTSTQYRMVGDHLGSATLLVDAQPTPQVVQRTYNKPYGEVAYSWSPSGGGPTSLTSIGYTGQRLEAESGLMYYGARFYDPALSYFVSGDTISPSKTDPRTRNRYSYVLNSPVKFVDPTGHQAESSTSSAPSETCDPANPNPSATCQDKYNELENLGIKVKGAWTAEELAWLLEAIHDILTATHWDIEAFRAAIGADRAAGKFLTFIRVHGPEDNTYDKYFPDTTYSTDKLVGREWGNGTITVYDLFGKNKNLAKRWIVHEIAHAIDSASGSTPGRCQGAGWFSCGMAGYVGADYTNGKYDRNRGTPASNWVGNDLREDFAEAFTAMVYAGNSDVLGADVGIPLHAPDVNRQRYIGMIVDYYREHRYR